MKRYVRTATEGSIKRTQNMAKNFSREEIERRREAGYRGESGDQILRNLMRDPNVEIGKPDEEGNRKIFYKGELKGWVNFQTGMGDFSDRNLYTQIKKAAKARPDYAVDVEEVEEETDEDEIDEDEE